MFDVNANSKDVRTSSLLGTLKLAQLQVDVRGCGQSPGPTALDTSAKDPELQGLMQRRQQAWHIASDVVMRWEGVLRSNCLLRIECERPSCRGRCSSMVA